MDCLKITEAMFQEQIILNSYLIRQIERTEFEICHLCEVAGLVDTEYELLD